MKQLENGVKIFYSNGKRKLWIGLGVLLGTVLILLLGVCFMHIQLKMIVLLSLILAAEIGAVVCLWKRHVPSVCEVYSDKLRARKQEMFWRDAQFYGVDAASKKQTFTLAGIAHGKEYRVEFPLQDLSESDRELFLQEVASRRVPTQQRYFERIQLELMGLSQGFKRVGRRMK